MPDAPHPSPGQSGLIVIAPAGALTSGAGGTKTIVASDALLAQVDVLHAITEALRLAAGSLMGLVDRRVAVGSIASEVPLAALDAQRVMDAALQQLWRAHARAADTRDAVVRALERYSATENAARALVHSIDEEAAWGLGFGARILSLPLVLAAAGGLLSALVQFRLSPEQLAGEAQLFLKTHGRILTNPTTVGIIREMAADADGFDAGFDAIPPPVAELLESTGLTGVKSGSATVVQDGRVFGLFDETPVAVHRTSSFEYGSPPTSLVDRANSFPIPETDPGGEQIRIDRYVTPGQPDRFDVYVAGTVTFDPKSESQPFDFTSDLVGVAGGSPASYRAVESAMAQAGVTPSSPVVLNGYSQGGLVASMLAASGKYNVKGVVTFGAPSGQVQIPASVPVLSVRNTEDLVPATSGYDVNPNAVVVEHSAFANQPIPSDWAVPAHRLSTYQATAALVDRSDSSEVRGVLDPLDAFGDGTTLVDSTLWVATRT